MLVENSTTTPTLNTDIKEWANQSRVTHVRVIASNGTQDEPLTD
jgi:hypothetical protein